MDAPVCKVCRTKHYGPCHVPSAKPVQAKPKGKRKGKSLKFIAARVRAVDTRRVKPQAKQADDELLTQEHRRWRAIVLARAGHRCQAITSNGTRCTTTAPLYADHIKERRDGGDPLDPANGQALCAKHHTAKTMRERAKRAGLPTNG